MRIPWKLIGLAGLAGVAATGVVVARRRRAQRDYDPEELRDRLHQRLAQAQSGQRRNPGQMTSSKISSTSVPSADTASDPRHPRLLEKNSNTAN